MKYTENALNILTAITYKNIGRAWINQHLPDIKSIAEIARLIKSKDPSIDDKNFIDTRNNIEELISQLGTENCDGVIALGDEGFPSFCNKVKPSERPVALFYQGDLSLLMMTHKNIAVIGLLEPDEDTRRDEQKIVAQLVANGATIVSGLANGCDSIAHRQALESNGKTIAILPSTLKRILPLEQSPLAKQIVESGGLLISEYYTNPTSMEQTRRYVERDRLQALFSGMVILTASYTHESGKDSGSRHAMEKAKEYSVPRAMIYHPERNATNEKYGLNRQIKNEELKNASLVVIDPDNPTPAIDEIFRLLGSKSQQGQASLPF